MTSISPGSEGRRRAREPVWDRASLASPGADSGVRLSWARIRRIVQTHQSALILPFAYRIFPGPHQAAFSYLL